MSAVVAGKTPWNVSTPSQFSLRQATGAIVTGPLSCISQSPQSLEVASDCSFVKGLRLGTYAVTVTGGGISAPASVKVTPIPQPLAPYNTSTIGPGTLAVPSDGRVLAWGGYLKWPSRPILDYRGLSLPRQMGEQRNGGFLGDLVAAAHGRDVTLALTEDGQVQTWGLGSSLGRNYTPESFISVGELYPGLATDSFGPLRGIVAISTAASGALALTQDGTVYAWGPYSTAVLPKPDNRVPRLLDLPGKAIAISSGQNWAAILLADGRVMSLRSGPGSEAPYNMTGRPSIPGVIGLNVGYVIDNRTGQPLENIVQVAAGGSHGLALSRDGQVLAWGENNLGQLGLGHSNNAPVSASPVVGPDGTGTLNGITMVAAGHAHSLAMDGAGHIYSWGLGTYGQLGDGPGQPRANNILRAFRPELVLDAAGTSPLSGARAVYGTTGNSIALMPDGRVLIWGLRSTNDLGQGAAVPPLYQGLPLAVLNEAGNGPLLMTPMAYWSDLGYRGSATP